MKVVEEIELLPLTSEIQNNQAIQNSQVTTNNSLLQIAYTTPFKIIFGSYLAVSFFDITLGLNYKTYVL